MSHLEIDLNQIAGGSLLTRVTEAVEQTLINMMDPETPWKPARTVQVELTFSQDEDRRMAKMNISVKTKLPAPEKVTTRIAYDMDYQKKRPVMQELGSQVRGQMSLDDYLPEQIVGDDVVDTDTGKIIGNVKPFMKKEG